MGTPVNIIVGSQVWVEDAEVAWIDGVVKEIKGREATVALSNDKTVKASLSRMHPKDTEADPSGVDDMTKLSYLHEPAVLQNLSSRFQLNEIYTYTGNILIAVNPFQRLPELYNLEKMAKYKGALLGELSPHLFAVADSCYRAIINDDGSQSILVSGESGAGKTETTKMLMRYLAFMGGRSGRLEARTIEQQVLESNPVLEAFGNAKTVKNNNSSRFGKFVEIQFDKHGKISGAAIRTYLLERSRVCQVSSPERNYHCFYMLCAAPPEEAKKFKVSDPKTFHYLNQSDCYEVAHVDDAKEYLETRHAMDIVGIVQEDQEAIFRVVAAILHLGNINFAKAKGGDSATLKDAESVRHLKTAVELLMCNEKLLEDSICKRVIATPDGKITKPLEPEAATLSRDALSKTIYSRLFDWIVDKINNSIGQDPSAKCIIGVLDIYGFESFRINSFEQLCINLTNEKLQQHFNQHVFKMEQEEYTKEKINWSYVEFVDNQDVLDLIEKKPGGIIALLDEACMFPKSTHETFAEKMYQTYKNHKRFTRPKLARTTFTINHYAGDVTYQADQFLDKNKDYVIAEHQALLNASKCHFVSNLFPPLPEETSKQSKFSSIGTRFKQQLQALMETLSTTEPHYIRCVKPNTVLKPGIFENFNALNQLRCGGVLEAIRISCAGYPTRRTFNEFITRFGRTLAPDLSKGTDEAKCVAAICDRMGLKGYQIGKTKVFLRAGQMAALDARRMEILSTAAKVIQRQGRTYLARKTYVTQRKTSVQIQKFWRAFLGRKLYKKMRKEDASIRIQKCARSFSARKSYKNLLLSARTIQTGIRAINARYELRDRRRNKAAIIIQTQWRLHKECSSYKNQKKATLVLQSLWRGCLGRKELRKLRMAARETGALKEAKEKLEKRVEELTQKLYAEKHMRDDLEEAKGQEIAKLQAKLQEMQEKLEQAQEEIMTGKEAARVEIVQEHSVNKEVPEADANMVELECRNKKLEEELSHFKSKAEEFEERYTKVLCQVEAARVEIVQENSVNKEVPDANANMVELTCRNKKLEEELSNFKSKAEEFEERYAKILNQVEATRVEIVQESSFNKEVPKAEANMVQLTHRNKKLEEELSNFKSKAEEFEERYTKVLNQVDELLKGTEESSSKISQLQDMIESLKRKINRSNSENELLHNQPAIIDHQQSVTSESIEPPLKDELLRDQPNQPSVTSSKSIEPPSENELLSDQITQPSVTSSESIEPLSKNELHHDPPAQPSVTSESIEPPSENKLFNDQPIQPTITPESIERASRNELLQDQSAQPSATSELIEPPISKITENGHTDGDEAKMRKKESTVAPQLPSFTKIKSLTNRQQDNYEALIKCLAEYKSFDNNRSAAAVIVYKSLFHWRSFEVERTNIFNRIVQTIKSSVKDQEDVSVLAYWLSTASTLLFLLQKNLRPHNASATGSYRSRAKASTLFSGMTRNTRSSSSILDLSSGYSEMLSKSGSQPRIEAKYPALLFKQQLTAFVENIYGMIRDNLKKEITPFLTKCLQAPSISRDRTPKSILSNILARQASSLHWKSLVKSLDCTLNALSENHVPPLIIRITFSQVFSFLNVQLFNSIILRRECCSFSNAEFVKGGLQELERWCSKTTESGAGTSWEQLQPVRQAIRFLVLQEKSEASFTDIKNKVCPVLSLAQISRLATMFWDDIDGTEGLSQEVITEMKDMMTKNSTSLLSPTVLLEDDLSIPFGFGDIARWGLDITIDNVEPPPLLRQNSEFHFLLPQQRRQKG